MKLLMAVAVVLTSAWAKEAAFPVIAILTICMNPGNPGNGDRHAFFVARATASKMLEEAGVKIVWRVNAEDCADLSNGIVAKISSATPVDEKPGALAYALPYKGDEIVVYYDRVVENAVTKDYIGALLGHVLTHEIVHLLEGIAEHSVSGLMKAVWTKEDRATMHQHPLALAQRDVDLIRRGLLTRTVSNK